MFDKALKQGIAAIGGRALSVSRSLLISVLLALPSSVPAYAKQPVGQDVIQRAALPAGAITTLSLIKQGGPFPFEKDGAVFGNYERKLLQRQRGYYHEYTVPTPHARNRGARRIIVGGEPSRHADYFYTGDHYASFQRIQDE